MGTSRSAQLTDVSTPPSALRIEGLSKYFGPQCALDDVDIAVEAGRIHALVGHNGSGKSTLVKILAGYHQPEPGARAHVAGNAFALGSAASARAAGLRVVHQDLALIEDLTVSDNVRLADPGPRLAPLRRRAERADARSAVEALGYAIDPAARVTDLVDSERTAVAVARALRGIDPASAASTAPLLVLDEPTASLPAPEAQRLFTAVRRIAAGGTAVLFVSHHLDEVLELADTVTVLRDGCRVTTRTTAGLTHDVLVELMLGRRVVAGRAARPSGSAARPARITASGLGGVVLSGLDLAVAAGEVVGVTGLTGSGREELAGLLAGRSPRRGTVAVDAAAVEPGDPRAAIAAGIAYVPADRARAVLAGAGVRENLTLADLRPFWRRGRLRRDPERAETQRWITELDIRPAHPDKRVGDLSGGNQQKVVLARWLRTGPAVLVLDEPTQGVDVGAKSDIHRLVDEAAAAGTAVVVCSSDAVELARLATSVLVLRRGRSPLRLSGAELTPAHIEQQQLSVEPAT